MKWEASFLNDRASWCTFSPESGKRGTAVLTISVSENSSYDERSASIVFNCKDSKQTIVVVQKQKDAVLISPSKVEVPESGGSYKVDVRHNINYSVEIGDDSKSWINIIGTKALSTSAITFNVNANEEISKRTGHILIKSDIGEETITVYQEGATPVMVLNENSFTLSDTGGIIEIEIKSNVNYEYEIIEGDGWIHEVKTKSMSTHTLQFEVVANETFDDRTGKIRFHDKDTGLEEYVTVFQKQKDALLLTQSEYTVSDEADIISVEVKSNVDFEYEIIEGDEWISEVKTKALTSHMLQFAIKANETFDDRTGKIRFHDKDTGLEEFVTVFQKHRPIVVSVDTLFFSGHGGEASFTTATGSLSDYRFVISESWLSIKQAASDSKACTITLSAQTNPKVYSRECSISVFFQNHSDPYTLVAIQMEQSPLVSYTTRNNTAVAPLLFGQEMKAFISWGDGTGDLYTPEIVHVFSSEGEHTITVESSGLKGIQIPVEHRMKVDFTELRKNE